MREIWRGKPRVNEISQPLARTGGHILMTRAAADCAAVAGLLQTLGDDIVYYQPFSTQPEKLAPAVVDEILAAVNDQAATLAFTSPRSVEALRLAAPQILVAWRQRLVYAVGPGTAAALLAEGFCHVDAAAGDSDALASRLRLMAGQQGVERVLHLGGHVAAADMAEKLAGSGIAVTRHVVYRAVLRTVPPEIATAIETGVITDIALLSARVTEHLAPLMLRAPHLPRLYCLSERIAVTARQVLSPEAPLIRVAPQPLLTALVPIMAAPHLPGSAD